MTQTHLYLFVILTSVLLTLAACEDDAYVAEVDSDEEQAACDALPAGSTGAFVPATATADDARTISGGGKRIELTSFGDSYGGFVEIAQITPEGETPLLLLVKEDVPLKITTASGELVNFREEETESAYCKVNGRFFWNQKGANYLEIGPTDRQQINVSVQVIE